MTMPTDPRWVPDPLRLRLAFYQGPIAEHYGWVELQRCPAPKVELPSGRVVACDPVADRERKPFSIEISPGHYEVSYTLCRASIDCRVAFAVLHLSKHQAISWDLLTVPGEDPKYPAYCVDAATGCFADPVALELLDRRMQSEQEFLDEVLDRTAGEQCCELRPGGMGAPNVVTFQSGGGDGFYATFVGYDPEGRPAAIVTDFQLVDGTVETGVSRRSEPPATSGPKPSFRSRLPPFPR